MLTRCCSVVSLVQVLTAVISLVAAIGGCGPAEYPEVSMDAARQVKSGMPLQDVVSTLGEPHPPTARQAQQLDEVVSKMPDAIRANAQKDESLAWGNDNGFLAVKVNDKGIVWVTAWHSN
ncbi:MAG: hypothetical protein ACO1RT_09805 [Planctomycetaceae bacterium]